MSEDPPHPGSEETVFGLDPRALLAPTPPPRDTGLFLRMWSPPSVEMLAPLFPQFDDFGWLGRGGMAAVYRARQPALERLVALKLLPPEAAEDPIFAERFRTEARTLARLSHPNIVTVHDSGQTPEGHLYIVMDFVGGGDVAALLVRGPLPVARALAIADAVSAALEYAHSRGIVHRDIKPANVLLSEEGTVKVADFGLARLRADTTASTPELTGDGTALGTPSYMAPEQRAGRPVDARCDLYSLGVMLYEMLTGELPHGAWRPPSHTVDTNSQLDSLVARALQRDPDRRVSTAAEFRRRLHGAGSSGGWNGRRAWILGGSMAAMAGLIAVAWRRQPPARVEGQPASLVPPIGPIPTTGWPPSPPGSYQPLDQLDLKTASLAGFWHWVDEAPGKVLAVASTHENPSIKILHLPVRPDTQAYDFRAEIWLDHRGSSLIIVFPAGEARPALVLDLFDHSGLECIQQSAWKSNETTVARLLPTGRFWPLFMSVRPDHNRVRIAVQVENLPFLQWEGEQGDISLPASDYPPALVHQHGHGLALFSMYGGVRFRGIDVKIQG